MFFFFLRFSLSLSLSPSLPLSVSGRRDCEFGRSSECWRSGDRHSINGIFSWNHVKPLQLCWSSCFQCWPPNETEWAKHNRTIWHIFFILQVWHIMQQEQGQLLKTTKIQASSLNTKNWWELFPPLELYPFEWSRCKDVVSQFAEFGAKWPTSDREQDRKKAKGTARCDCECHEWIRESTQHSAWLSFPQGVSSQHVEFSLGRVPAKKLLPQSLPWRTWNAPWKNMEKPYSFFKQK